MRGVPQVVVSTGDLQTRLEQWVRGRAEADAEESGLELHARPELPTGYVEPATATERELAEIWQTLLGIEPVGAHDDFFDAATATVALIEGFQKRELNAGAAIGGALTQLLTHLIDVSPDVSSAMGLLSSCLNNASFQAETVEAAMRSESSTTH